MVPGGVTEIIYHFAGYFHLITETAKERIVYEDGGVPVRPDDYVVQLRDDIVRPDLDEIKTERIPDSRFQGPDAITSYSIPAYFERPPKPFEEPDEDTGGPRKLPQMTKPVAGGAIGEFDPLKIRLIYDDDVGQQQLDVTQFNNMDDDDLLGAQEDSPVTRLHDIDVDATLAELIGKSEEHIPDDLALPLTGVMAAAEFVAARDADIKENGGDNEHSVAPGRYVNGELVEEPEGEPAPEEPPPLDLALEGQWAMLGGNEATNAALIVDIREASNTMIVLGDYFKTNAIIQTNAYIDNDNVRVAGGENYAPIIGGNNTADNIAEFIQNDGIFPQTPVFHAGLQWNIHVVDGDFYDINVVYQKNLLRDNDVSVQDSYATHYEAHLGENEQLNLFQIFNGEVRYDLIVVCGDFHAANLIYQYNVLLDADILKIAAGADAGETTSQSGSSGENALLNDAVIVGYGDNFFAVPEDDLDFILESLASRSSSLDPSQGWLLPGNGSGVLEVLYVTGDYFDINAIWQINVVADLDTAIQLGLCPPEDGESFTQDASTGSNALTNDAAIVDVGANNSLVGGEVYQDSILIQANLVTDNNDKIVQGDPNTLVNEVIAFTGDDAEQTSETELPDTGSTDLNSDPMGSMLT